MVHIVGAGPGAPDLITVRGKELISRADTIIYAGSLVNPALLEYRKEGCRVLNSAYMTLDQVVEAVRETEAEGKMTVRLHTGTPASMGRSGNRWMNLTVWGSPIKSARESAPSVEPPQP